MRCPGSFPTKCARSVAAVSWKWQAEISAELLKAKIGSVQRVIIDESEDADGVAVGRTTADAPDIDGVIYVTTDRHLEPATSSTCADGKRRARSRGPRG